MTTTELGLTGWQTGSGTYNDSMFTAPVLLGYGDYGFITGPNLCALEALIADADR
jgi:hypothetical protein